MSEADVRDGIGTLDAGSLRRRYRSGDLAPLAVIEAVLARIESRGDDHVWISRVDPAAVLAAAAALDVADVERLPLWGLPFAVKDNIDVAGLPTTAGCPAYAYDPAAGAPLVERLVAAGAVLVGKTNLDQFATGLNGTRSPYGIPVSVFGDGDISGGSSSGSAVAVAAGLVSFAIGTDTAGSGRVPAALNNVVGVKPSIGLVDTAGVVPACGSLDCVSVFSLTVADGAAVLAVLAGTESGAPRVRLLPAPPPVARPVGLAGVRLAVPDDVSWWGDRGEDEAWAACCERVSAAGAVLEKVDLSGFLEAGEQLYGGAWLAERLDGFEEFLSASAADVHPVIREVLSPAAVIRGVEVFTAMDRMSRLRSDAHALLSGYDALLTPTTEGTWTVEQMLADPVVRNARLGTWTTFTNLLDLCAVALPAGLTRTGSPFGVSVQAVAGRDAELAALAAALERLTTVPPGAPGVPVSEAVSGGLSLAVVGAHLEGMPLHGELIDRGAHLLRRTTTSADYRLFALAGATPPKPGLKRVRAGGRPIEVEVYRLPARAAASFLDTVAAPLGIGQVTLADGSVVHGFICEPMALEEASDISDFGGWRAFVAAGAGGR
jgi:allophanate hydrolase